ncbi:Cu2+-exporting ATPase [Alternaria panax]|uniref:Cu2+-exporting ATPase n=1 Tax=Alternaria panax TaxID=48097 RepID=A0AAD4FFA7_9PLEO|nr:Cu2+-exporting ATPase [Alternaria panax]
MEMSMVTAVSGGALRARLQELGSTDSQDPTPELPASNPHAVAYPVRTPYTNSSYSRAEEAAPQTFHTNGVQYASKAPGARPNNVASPNSDFGPSWLRFEASHSDDQFAAIPLNFDGAPDLPAKLEAPNPPWGNCPFPHVQTTDKIQNPAPVPVPVPMPISAPKAKPNRRPLWAVSSCCSAVRPHKSLATTHGEDHQVSIKVEDNSGFHEPHNHPHTMGICCSELLHSSGNSSLKDLGDTTILGEHDDPELGPPNFERVILRIDGLKCGCCESGLSRTVDRIPNIKNFRLNTVLARVELELDTNRLSVRKVINLLETRTGYKFEEQVVSVGQVLEVIVTDPRRMQHAGLPDGVIRIEVPERVPWRPFAVLSGHTNATPKKTTTSDADEDRGISKIRVPPTKIHYDATMIGARDVLQHYHKFDPDLRLAPMVADPGLDLGARQTIRALKWFLLSLIFTIPVLVFAWAPVGRSPKVASKSTYLPGLHTSLALATVVQIIAFKEFFPGAMRSLYHSCVFEMDFLIAFSTTMAYSFSVASYIFQVRGKPLETGSFFETSTLLVTLILLGRVINEFARFRAAKSVSFRSLQNDKAIIAVHPEEGTTFWSNAPKTKIDTRLLQYGDYFTVPPHTRIATDGVVVYGGSNVDESMITGEFKPKAKGLGSEVFAGTNNGTGFLVVRLTKLPHENSVQRIAALVEDAELTKPKTQALADRVASWFVPVMASIGLSVFLIWLFVDRYHKRKDWRSAGLTAITYAIATLIVSCPCAIGLAVPMVVLIASGVAARYGIIFRDPQKLEIARNVTDVVFDKTGTITSGTLKVVNVPRYRNTDHARQKGLLMSLLKDIQHPVSIAITHWLAQDMLVHKNFEPLEVINITSIPGKGVQGICAETGVQIRAGNAEWLKINVLGSEANTMCYYTYDGDLRASFALMDYPRPGAEMVIQKLLTRGIEVHILSGDSAGAVASIASRLYIPQGNTKACCKPEGKMNYVRDLQTPGKVVMFVGDGTNDAVALRQAHVGVHLNQGSDVAKSAADVVLMTTRLHDVLILLDISLAAYRRIVLNFSWSAFYNIVAVLLAAGALVKLGDQVRIKPQWAGLGELVSVLPVVLVAFQMRWRDYGKSYRIIETEYQKVEAPKRERHIRTRGSSSADGTGCCEIPATTLAQVDAFTRRDEKGRLRRFLLGSS